MKEIEKKENLKFNFALYIKQDRHNLLYHHFTYSKNYSYLFSKKKKLFNKRTPSIEQINSFKFK